MSRFRVYIKQYINENVYADDFTEITKDVQKLGTISQQLDNSDYGVGVFRNTNFSFTVKNDKGLYSEADLLRSIFKWKRSDAIIKVTWDMSPQDLICGFFQPGMVVLGGEVEIYRGLLTEVSQSTSIVEQTVNFSCLGFESLFDRVTVPFDDINDGDDVSEILLACLNQSIITNYLTVDEANIVVGNDVAIDLKESLENKTVKEALDDLLFLTNSILVIENETVYVRSRDPDAEVVHTFYGQASTDGIESIISLANFRDGFNRLFNFWTWEDTALVSKDITSVDKHGVYKNQLDSSLIDVASTAKIQSILDENRTEFSFPKTEFNLVAPVTYDHLDLKRLNKVNVDYPNVYVPADNNPLPRYGQNYYNSGAVYPYGIFPVTISPTDAYKIIGKKIDPVKSVIDFTLRKV